MARVRDHKLLQALPFVEGFAKAHAKEFQAGDRWGEYLCVGWHDGQTAKVIWVFPYPELSVEGEARVVGDAGEAETRRDFGPVASDAADFGQALTTLLTTAWEWLEHLDASAVQDADEARSLHVAEKVVPAVLRFALSSNCSVREVGESNCIVSWPLGDPQYALRVHYAPHLGIGLSGCRTTPKGLLRRRKWVLGEGLLTDLTIGDWTETDALPGVLREAKRRVEAWTPPRDAPETVID
jgi:hypothetical protein